MLLDGPLEKSDWMPQQNLSSEVNFDLHDVSLESLTVRLCFGQPNLFITPSGKFFEQFFLTL